MAIAASVGLESTLDPNRYHAYVRVDVPDGVSFNILQHGRVHRTRCERAVANQTSAILSSCVGCQVRESACLTEINKSQERWLGMEAIRFVSARINGGVIVYDHADNDQALENCRQGQQYASQHPQRSELACYPADTHRPLSVRDQDRLEARQRVQHHYQNSLGLLTITLASVIAIGVLNRRRIKNYIPIWPPKLILAGTDLLLLLVLFNWLGFPAGHDIPGWLNYDLRNLSVHTALSFFTVGWLWLIVEHYTRRRPFWDELQQTLRTLGYIFLIAATAVFFIGLETDSLTHLWLWGSAFVLLPMGRVAARAVLDFFGLWRKSAVIIGAGPNAQDAYKAINSEQGMGYGIAAFIQPNGTVPSPRTLREAERTAQAEGDVPLSFLGASQSAVISIAGETVPVLQPRTTLEHLLQELRSPQIVLALDSLNTAEAQNLLQRLTLTQNNIHVVPSIRGLPLFGTQLSHFFSHEVLFLTVRNNLSRRGYQWIKRSFDIIGSATLLLLFLPVMAAAAWRIWREDGGPVMLSQLRVAHKAGEFRCLKFRSMVVDAEAILAQWRITDSKEWREYYKNNFKLASDPRVTQVGRWMRRTSIDELPQLLNVLIGNMSLVGPRPLLSRELSEYGEVIELYRQMRPGITGLWQISGRSGTSFIDRAELDAWYAQNWSIWYDIAILFKTVSVVLKSRGAY